MPYRAEAIPKARIAPQDPVFDEFPDGDFVGGNIRHGTVHSFHFNGEERMVSDIAAFDLLAQFLDRFPDMLQMRVDRQRPPVGLQRVRVVTELLQDKTEAG